MRIVTKLLGWALFTVIFFAACSSASSPEPAAVSSTSAPAGAFQPAAVATSRGDKLEASEPASVKYGAGRPVLIEFFRFT